MTPITVFIAVVVAALILHDWRKALPALFLIGVLQDVLRKLTPGAPAYFILGIGSMFVLIFIVAYAQGSVRGLRPLYLHDARLRTAWGLFILVVVLQAGHTLVRWGNPMIAVLGLVFYLGPILALLIGFAYARSEQRIIHLLTVYVLIMVPSALTVYLSAEYGDQWPVLRDVGTFTGTQLVISFGGASMASYPGIFRVGELAAWHAATSIAFLSILVIRKPSLLSMIVAGLLGSLLVGVIILTGRRKMLMTLTVFFSFQWVLILLLRKGLTRANGILLLLAVVGTLAFSLLGHEEGIGETSAYSERGLSVLESTDDRLDTTLNLVQSAWYRSGGIGVGAGVAGQGARFAGGSGAQAVGGSAEAGLGMIIVELGLAGLVAMIWLLYCLTTRMWAGLRMLARINVRWMIYGASFAAFLIANLATFGVAVQLYSDYVVLILLGLVAGMLFALVSAGIELYYAQGRLRWEQRMGTVDWAGAPAARPTTPDLQGDPFAGGRTINSYSQLVSPLIRLATRNSHLSAYVNEFCLSINGGPKGSLITSIPR